MSRVALGFRAHSGWAAVVAVAGTPRDSQVVHRGRMELVDHSVKGSAQPYHRARAMMLPDAEAFIRSVTDTTNEMAEKAIAATIVDLKSKGHTVAVCAIVLPSGRTIPSLEATLRSHAMVHTAEGELFRGAIAHAAMRCGLHISGVKESELYDQAAEALHLSPEKLKSRLREMGKAVGSPWTSDEKNATLVAWLALTADSRS